uniref:Metallo-beta-lactamase domain-containing protein 1 n=1 Tax=Anopheles christyi TaxID=43041 RepID=A0A182KCJ5_9DIPT
MINASVDDARTVLQEHQLHPDDIDYVVSTHGHSDHLGNNNLFLGAKRHIVGTNISHRNRYYVHDFDAGIRWNCPLRQR